MSAFANTKERCVAISQVQPQQVEGTWREAWFNYTMRMESNTLTLKCNTHLQKDQFREIYQFQFQLALKKMGK